MKKRWIFRPLLFGASFAIVVFILLNLQYMWTTAVISATLKRCPDKPKEYQTTLPLGDSKAISLAYPRIRY